MKHIIELTKLAIQEKRKEIEDLEQKMTDAQELVGNLLQELDLLEAMELNKPKLAHPKEEYGG